MKYIDLLKGIDFEGSVPEGNGEFITQDSRKVTKGCVFVCIKGNNSDGHDFAEKALADGAGLLVCSRSLGLENEIIVENTREAFSIMSRNYFGNPSEKLTLVAVTGTNGKSTVTSLIKQVLEFNGVKCGLIGTIGNEIGSLCVPAKFTTPEAWDLNALFARMLKAGCTHVIMEASSQALDQERVFGLQFKLGVFTNLSQDHLDYHGNMENYFAAKEKLFKQCDIILVNQDDKWGQKLIDANYKNAYTYAVSNGKNNAKADFSALEPKLYASKSEFEFVFGSKKEKVIFPMPGDYSVYNAVAAGASAVLLGFEYEKARQALEEVKSIRGRCEVLYDGDFTIVCDFAHTDDALEKVLGALRPFAKKRLIALFGCAGERDKTKRPKMASAVAKYADEIIITSDNPRKENPVSIINDVMPVLENTGKVLYAEPDRAKAVSLAVDMLEKGDILVLCGKGHEDYQAMDGHTLYFSEHEIVEKLISEK